MRHTGRATISTGRQPHGVARVMTAAHVALSGTGSFLGDGHGFLLVSLA